MRTLDLDTVLQHYVVCALWASTGDNDEPLDRDHGPQDIHPDTLAKMREDVVDFCEGNMTVLLLSEMSAEQIGHDFWLTRNRHGAGFWDRGNAMGTRLTEACRPYGSFDLYVGDDGKIHGS